jgi:hypothetical protein
VDDLQLNEWASMSFRVLQSLAPARQVKTPQLQSVASTFFDNCYGMSLLSFFPIRLFASGRLSFMAEAIAAMELTGEPYPRRRAEPTVSETTRQEILGTRDKILKGNVKYDNYLMMDAASPSDVMVRSNENDVNLIRTLMSSQVTLAWTIFETLAGDLWRAAVNAQPAYLAGLTGAENRIEDRMRKMKTPSQEDGSPEEEENMGTGEDDDHCEPPSQRHINLGAICKVTRGKYDLGDKMGTLLAETKRVQFTSLESIRQAYSLAFPEKVSRARSSRIDATLGDNGLDSLSAVRNVIVHKAGIADAEYMDRAKSARTAPRLKEGDALQLDGEKCPILIEPAMKSGAELVAAVDSWLTLTRR